MIMKMGGYVLKSTFLLDHEENISYRFKQLQNICGKPLSDTWKKVKVGNDQEMAQSERNSHSTNRGVGKNRMTFRYLYQENIS